MLALSIALIPIVPLRMAGLLSLDERDRAQEVLQSAIGNAAVAYRMRGGLQSRLEQGASAVMRQEEVLHAAERAKIAARAEVVKLRRIRATIEARTGTSLPTKDTAVIVRDAARERFADLWRQRSSAAMVRSRLARWMLWGSGDERLFRFQERLVKDLSAAVSVLERLEKAEAAREQVLVAYAQAVRMYAETVGYAALNETQLRENRRIMAEVHEQVLLLQGDLARIDATLRRKAARALVQKGILTSEDIVHASASDASFVWPVYGRISAGFLNKPYVERFGVQHYGADIVVPQRTPVAAAADGVVFLVRDGGRTGYTYVLIGHRDGYATLYGHLNETLITAGQEVSAGETIAFSGGTPGTYGAGPMTTAAHLHFEVIRNGVNVDPLTVLP